jgi:hypothetical protein
VAGVGAGGPLEQGLQDGPADAAAAHALVDGDLPDEERARLGRRPVGGGEGHHLTVSHRHDRGGREVGAHQEVGVGRVLVEAPAPPGEPPHRRCVAYPGGPEIDVTLRSGARGGFDRHEEEL